MFSMGEFLLFKDIAVSRPVRILVNWEGTLLYKDTFARMVGGFCLAFWIPLPCCTRFYNYVSINRSHRTAIIAHMKIYGGNLVVYDLCTVE